MPVNDVLKDGTVVGKTHRRKVFGVKRWIAIGHMIDRSSLTMMKVDYIRHIENNFRGCFGPAILAAAISLPNVYLVCPDRWGEQRLFPVRANQP